MPRELPGRAPRRSGVLRPGRTLRGLLVLVAVLATGTACTPLDDAMVAIFGRSMRWQRSFDPYEQPHQPAENAVPFASGNYPAQIWDVQSGQAEMGPSLPEFSLADMSPPGADVVRTLENPVPADSASLARGQEQYDIFCAVCHGPAGISSEAPVVDKIPALNAYNLATGNAVGYTDGYIYGMIRIGRGLMPAYGHRITHFDRWHIVNYVRRLQQEAGSAPAGGGEGATPADTAGQGGL